MACRILFVVTLVSALGACSGKPRQPPGQAASVQAEPARPLQYGYGTTLEAAAVQCHDQGLESTTDTTRAPDGDLQMPCGPTQLYGYGATVEGAAAQCRQQGQLPSADTSRVSGTNEIQMACKRSK